MAEKTVWQNEIRRIVGSLQLSPMREAEVVEELSQHVEDRYQELLADGLTDAEASQNALAELRPSELITELRRIETPITQEPIILGHRGLGRLTVGLWPDIRYALRMLKTHPAVTLVAVFAMALSIGVNTAMFSTLQMLLFRPFAFGNQDRLLRIWEQTSAGSITRWPVAPANFFDWRDQNSTFERLAAFKPAEFDVSAGGPPEHVNGNRVTSGFFEILGVKAALGRTFAEDENAPGTNQVVVLKHSLWQSRFGGDHAIVGRHIIINGQPNTVIGVMPSDFDFPIGGELWAPLLISPEDRANRTDRHLQVVGLLRPGMTMEKAREDLQTIAQRAQKLYSATNSGRDVGLVPLVEYETRASRVGATFMFVSSLLVLLIGCANVANLLLARAASQQREIAVRVVLGASRFRMMRQFLADSIILAILGGAFGLLIAIWSVKAIRAAIPHDLAKFIPGWERMAIDPTALIFTLVVSVATGLIVGLIPAIAGTRLNINEALKAGGRGAIGSGAQRSRRILVISQVACSVVVLAGAAVMIRSFTRLISTNLGVEPTNVLTVQVSLAHDQYDDTQSRVNFYQTLLDHLAATPDVAKVGAVSALPFGYTAEKRQCAKIGDLAFPENQRPSLKSRVATPGYLDAIGTPLRRGRNFSEQDLDGKPGVAMVNEAFARHFMPSREVIGQQIKCGDGKPIEIIGVLADVMNEDFDGRIEPEIYLPFRQDPSRTVYLVIRATSNPAEMAAVVRREVGSLDQSASVFNVKSLDQLIDERLSPKRLAVYTLAAAALIALILAAVGIYAVIAHSVNQRKDEIGLRLALGAQTTDIMRLVIGSGMKLVFIGCMLGLIGAIALTRSLARLMFGVSVTDPLMFATVTVLLLIAAFLACYVPARTALRVDPALALKQQ